MTNESTSDILTPHPAAGSTTHRPVPMQAAVSSAPPDDASTRVRTPGRPGNLLVAREGSVHGTALLRQETDGLRRAGLRVAAQVESQDVLLGELRKVLAAIDSEAAEGTRGTLQRLTRTASEIVDWCDAVQIELHSEASRAVDGRQAVDLLELVHSVIHDCGIDGREVVVCGSAPFAVWASVPVLGRALRQGFELVLERAQGAARLLVEIGQDDDGHFLVVRTRAEDVVEPSQGKVDEFREAAEAAGLEVQPDPDTQGRSGLLLRLPAHDRGPMVPLS